MLRPFALLVLLVSFGSASGANAQIRADEAFPGVTFAFPVGVAIAPGQPDRLYVIEKGEMAVSPEAPSRIVSIAPGETEPTVFLDLTPLAWPGQEAGLLGLAFHPDYETNRKFYVYYGARGQQRTVLAEYRQVGSNPLVANPNTARILLEVEQPLSIHNGGTMSFGPDGYLYVGYGDGRGPADVDGNGQNLGSILGSLIRIDVDSRTDGLPYGIPPDNPFVGNADARPETYAYGLRSPWKFTFDSQTGDIWLGDVGETDWEEVNVIEAGGNYGWVDMEGPDCFRPGCDVSQYEAPLYAYQHTPNAGGGLSVTGGVVYRGSDLAGLQGRYIFADFVFPRLWLLNEDADGVTLLSSAVSNIASIDEDSDGEILLTSFSEGKIYRLQQDGISTGPGVEPLAPSLRLESANPVRDRARFTLSASGGTPVRVTAYDARGRTLDVLYDDVAPGSDLELTLDARGLSPGVIFVRLDASTGRTVVPLTVVR